MSKVFGLVLLIGLVGSVLLSIGLLLFTWIRDGNDHPTAPVAPTTKAALIRHPESLGYVLVDARQVVATANFSGLEG